MRIRPLSVAACRAAVAALSVYVLLLGTYVPAFGSAAGRASAEALCIPTAGEEHRPNRPSPHDPGCCAAPCPVGAGAPAPSSSAATAQHKTGWALIDWTEATPAIPPAGALTNARARDPPAAA